MDNTFDIAIVGSGIAGSALACALTANASSQATPLRIALIEAQPLASHLPEREGEINDFDPRVSALTVASQAFLSELGVWPTMAEQGISRFEKMQVWDAEGTGEVSFDAADVRAPVLGHIVENRVTVAALVKQLKLASNIHIFDGHSVARLRLPETSIDKQPELESQLEPQLEPQLQPQLELDNGTVISSTLIVAADGAHSPLRDMAGLTIREWDYQHDALVCTVRVEQPHQQTAWQRFTSHGPLAFLPLTVAANDKHYCSIVWSQTPEQTAAAMAMDDDAFCAALGRAFEHRLGKVMACSQRFSFPLRQRHAIDYVKPGFALIADAAHSIHPLAGQGINLGLADVQVLSKCILAAHTRGQSVGDIAILNRYQRQRKGDNLAMMAAVEGFKRLFAPIPLPLRWLRNAGMNVLQQQKKLKNQIIKYAMGIN